VTLISFADLGCVGNKKDNLTIIYTPGSNLKVGTSSCTHLDLALT